jgi:hypothetical protein
MTLPHRYAALKQKAADLIGDTRALPDQARAHPVQCQQIHLLRRLVHGTRSALLFSRTIRHAEVEISHRVPHVLKHERLPAKTAKSTAKRIEWAGWVHPQLTDLCAKAHGLPLAAHCRSDR